MERSDDLEARVEAWLGRCAEIASGPLDGIEDASAELARAAAGDRKLMERARRRLLALQDKDASDPLVAQMLSLWRRAFEKGSWDWAD
jgi:hypothetical protein